MTLQYDKLPIEGAEGPHMPDAEREAWQAANPPLVTVQVWVGTEGRVMSHVSWHESINAEDEPLLKPLADMLTAAVGLHRTADRLETALAMAVQYQEVLAAMSRDGN